MKPHADPFPEDDSGEADEKLDEKLDELVTELRLGRSNSVETIPPPDLPPRTDVMPTPAPSKPETLQVPPTPVPAATSPRATRAATKPAPPASSAAQSQSAAAAAPKKKRKVCRRRNLQVLPADFRETVSAALAIDVSCNKLKVFPLEVLEAPKVKELDVSSNRISEVPAEVVRLSTLRAIRLSVNCLTELPAHLFRMPVLRELHATGMSLRSLDVPSEGHLAPLEVVDVSNNALEHLPRSIGQLKRLKVLNVDQNRLRELPEELGALANLTELRAASNQLRKLHNSTVRWQRLDRLELFSNRLKALPSTWFDGRTPAPPIVHLQLQKNCFEELPVSFFQSLASLASLDMTENRLRFIPASIASATRLESLYIGGNALMELPAHIGQLPSLAFLDVSRNRLRRIPDFAGCPRLNALTAGYNPLAALPASLPQSLSELHLSGCALKTLPVYRLPKLEAFMIANNELTFVDFGRMIDAERIQYIDISHNKLTALPQGIYSAREDSALELDFSHNLFALAVNDSALVRPGTFGPRMGVGMSEMQGRRDSMEDVVCMLGDLTGDATTDLLAVFDGHGGSDVATLASRSVVQFLRDNLPKRRPEECIVEALRRTNRLFESQTPSTMQGTTVVLGLFCGGPTAGGESPPPPAPAPSPDSSERKEGGGGGGGGNKRRTLHCVNVGDSRAVMSHGGKAVRLSYDHKPLLPEEYDRVTSAGGFVTEEGSIQGIVSVARALGDYPLRPYITDEPRCATFELDDSDEFVIFACDGLWDVLSDDDAVRIARDALAKPGATPATVSLLLRDWAYLSGSADNISVIVGVMNPPKPAATPLMTTSAGPSPV